MTVTETERLRVCHWTLDDAPFLYELVNTPDWLRFIGDRGVRTLDDARRYISERFIQSYQTLGFGLYLVFLKDSHHPIGACGLIKRDALTEVDLGFALMPAYIGKGYAYEAAQAVMQYAWQVAGLHRLAAITLEDNIRSIQLLKKLGFDLQEKRQLAPDTDEVLLFIHSFHQDASAHTLSAS